MIDDAYHVVVPRELEARWDALPERDHAKLADRLDRAARAAHRHPVEWPVGAPGIYRGRHRALVGNFWLLYHRDDAHRTIQLIGFGRSAG